MYKRQSFHFLSRLMILPCSSFYKKDNIEEILMVYNGGDYIEEDNLAECQEW